MATKRVIKERLEYVRKHITDEPYELAEALGVSGHTASRYKKHLTFGEPISGKHSAKVKAKKAALTETLTPTLEQRVESLELGLEMEQAARVQVLDNLLEITLKVVSLDGKVSALIEKLTKI